MLLVRQKKLKLTRFRKKNIPIIQPKSYKKAENTNPDSGQSSATRKETEM